MDCGNRAASEGAPRCVGGGGTSPSWSAAAEGAAAEAGGAGIASPGLCASSSTDANRAEDPEDGCEPAPDRMVSGLTGSL